MSIERRDLLKLMWRGLFTLAVGGNGYLVYFLRQSPEQPAVKVLEENWPEIKVSSRVDLGIRVIANIESYQVPPIGLKEICFFSHSDYPVVAVGIVFDRKEVTQGSQQEKIRWGFQEINNPFVPDVSLALAEVDIGGSRISKEEGDRLAQAFGERIRTTRPFPNVVGVRLITRPPENKKMALVFGEGLVNYNGYPSPSSFLTLQFNFERVVSPGEVSL